MLETVPSHYGTNGIIDEWSGKASIWILPVLSVGFYVLFLSLQALIYKIYDVHAIELLTVKMLAVIKLSLILAFALISIQIIQDAFNTFWFVKFWMIYGTLLLAGIGILFYSVKMIILNYRINKTSL